MDRIVSLITNKCPLINAFHVPETKVTTFTNIIHDVQMNVTSFTSANAVL